MNFYSEATPPMRRRFFLKAFAMTGVLVIATVAVVLLRPSGERDTMDHSGEVSTVAEPPPAHSVVGSVASPGVNRTDRSSGNRVMDDERTAGDPLLLAQSSWDRRHHIPTEEEWAHLQGLSEQELERMAKAGDVVAMAALGERLILQGVPGGEDVARGSDWLSEATVHGSTHAAQILGELTVTHLTPGDSEDDRIFREQASAGYFAMAYLMGDASALAGLQTVMGSNPASVSVAHYLSVGMRRMQALQMSRQMRGMPPLDTQPRPVSSSLPPILPPEG